MNIEGFTVTAFLKEISSRLDQAAAVARAGLECAERGANNEAIGTVLDLDQAIQELGTLHQAMLILRRPRRPLIQG